MNKEPNADVREIGKIDFGVYSAEEITTMSVAEIDITKTEGHGSVYDERMGSNFETEEPCVTCKLSASKCPGHFGHITLSEPIIHPLFYKMVISFLKCFCISFHV